MKRLLTTSLILAGFFNLGAQDIKIPSRGSEDSENIMSAGYWEIWNDAEQERIDKDIDLYRKADGVFKIGKVKKGTLVNV